MEILNKNIEEISLGAKITEVKIVDERYLDITFEKSVTANGKQIGKIEVRIPKLYISEANDYENIKCHAIAVHDEESDDNSLIYRYVKYTYLNSEQN